MSAMSASLISRMKFLQGPVGSTATWRFCAFGSADGDTAAEIPLIVVPGGPGLPHGYLRSLAALARPGRPVVFYDPLGCGRSQVHTEGGTRACTFVTLVDEFRAVVEHFAEPDGCFVLGHSSGGWIALEGVLRDAATRSRVAKLILASVPLDIPAFIEEQQRLISALGTRAHRRLRRPPPAGGRGAAAYNRHYERFLHQHICRPPWPADLVEATAQSNRAIYEALWGPSEVWVTGELRDWTCTDRVDALDIPIFLTSGRHDEVTPALMRRAAELLPTAQWHLFDGSAHMPHLEEPEHYAAAVDRFLESGRVSGR